MVQEYQDLAVQLESLGETEVRERLAHKKYAERNLSFVQEWLRRKDQEREDKRSAKRDAREEETLSIAKEANRIASEALVIARSSSDAVRKQARWAMIAAIIAAITAIVSNIILIFS